VVNGLQVLARKRRIMIEQIEAVVEGQLNNPLIYLGVIGETGHPGLDQVSVRVSLLSSAADAAIQDLWQEMMATSPLVRTFQQAIQLELRLQVLE
jgi:hypothetical protein